MRQPCLYDSSKNRTPHTGNACGSRFVPHLIMSTAAKLVPSFRATAAIPQKHSLRSMTEANRLAFLKSPFGPYAEGCYSGRVAYLEGWYVEPSARRKGVGAALVKTVEEWGRSQGCTSLAPTPK